MTVTAQQLYADGELYSIAVRYFLEDLSDPYLMPPQPTKWECCEALASWIPHEPKFEKIPFHQKGDWNH